MRAIFVSATILLAVIETGCGVSRSSSPPLSPAPTPGLSEAPVGEPTASPEPTATPVPEPTAIPSPKPTPKPSPVVLSANEKFLLAGLRADAKVKCEARRTNLPPRAIAGIECSPSKEGVERVGVYLFKSEPAMIATYKERMAQEGVKLNTGSCYEGEGESNYFPGDIDAEVIERNGCFVNEFGIANYRATVPSGPAYVGLLGTSGNTRALEDYVWKGNEDVPGVPTIWQGLHTGP